MNKKTDDKNLELVGQYGQFYGSMDLFRREAISCSDNYGHLLTQHEKETLEGISETADKLIAVVVGKFDHIGQPTDKAKTECDRIRYRLEIHPAMEAGDIHTRFLFETIEELNAAKNTCASLLIFMQDEAKIMKDYSNMFICEQLIDGEWEELDE